MLGTLIDWWRDSEVPGRSVKLEQAVERARTLRSRDGRLALYREVDRQLVAEQVMVVPTLYLSEYVVYRPWLEGLWVNQLSMSPLNELVVQPH